MKRYQNYRHRRFALLGMVPFVFLLPSAHGQWLDVRDGADVPLEVTVLYEKGVDYLARSQEEDGSFGEGAGQWGLERYGICALGLMALLATGEDPNYGKYALNIQPALRCIIRGQDPKTGYIPENMYVHGFAMLALAEAYGAVDDRLLWEDQEESDRHRTVGQALELAVRLAVDSQKKNRFGGWRYAPTAGDADTSVVGTILMGLLAARNAGIAVPDDVVDKALKYIKSMTSEGGIVSYATMGDRQSLATDAIGCLVFSVSARKHWDEYHATSKRLADRLLSPASSHWPWYERYYRAQALFQADYPAWQKWNRSQARILRKLQKKDGSIGESHHGNTYSTSMALLTLALNYRFLPIYERF